MWFSFPVMMNDSATFNSSYTTVCIGHNGPFSQDPEHCTASSSEVKAAAVVFLPGNEPMILYISDLCDAFGLPLPRPNEIIRVQYADPNVHHKPGGKVS
jgi:hypothetical protein